MMSSVPTSVKPRLWRRPGCLPDRHVGWNDVRPQADPQTAVAEKNQGEREHEGERMSPPASVRKRANVASATSSGTGENQRMLGKVNQRVAMYSWASGVQTLIATMTASNTQVR